MSDVIIHCIICGVIPIITIPIVMFICKYHIFKEIQVNNEENVESNSEIENTNRYKCQICGALFKLNKASRYLTMDNEAPIMAVFSVPTTYECFDCPKCGCQNRVNERKGSCIIDEQTEVDTDEHL